MKVVYIIPGNREDATSERYSLIRGAFKDKGYKVISVHISWKYKTMKHYVQEFLIQYTKHKKNDTVCIAGFSFGAMISYIASSQLSDINTQFLCSLSPYFMEYRQKIPTLREKIMGKRKMEYFSTISFNKLAKNIACKTHIFYGACEHYLLQDIAKDAHKKINHSTLIGVQGAGHDIENKAYIAAINEKIQ